MNILEQARADIQKLADATPAAAPAAKRAKTQFWLNVGVPVLNADGTTTLVNYPMGIAVDDVKPVEVKGSSPTFIQLQQAKNLLREAVAQEATTLAPGEHRILNGFVVEIARVAAPDQTGNIAENTLMQGLIAAIGAASKQS